MHDIISYTYFTQTYQGLTVNIKAYTYIYRPRILATDKKQNPVFIMPSKQYTENLLTTGENICISHIYTKRVQNTAMIEIVSFFHANEKNDIE